MKILYADEVHAASAEAVAAAIMERVGGGPVYLTFDIDCSIRPLPPVLARPFREGSLPIRPSRSSGRSRDWM
jgi:agmatinase